MPKWKKEEPVETVEVCVEFVRQTDKAVCVTDSSEYVWLPKSQLVDFDPEQFLAPGITFTVTIPEWLAIEKRLV